MKRAHINKQAQEGKRNRIRIIKSSANRLYSRGLIGIQTEVLICSINSGELEHTSLVLLQWKAQLYDSCSQAEPRHFPPLHSTGL